MSAPLTGTGTWFAPARLQPYLNATGQDPDDALRLYLLSTELASACFEAVSHVEVMLRHAIDVQLSQHLRDAGCGIPWFLRPLGSSAKAQTRIDADIEVARRRLRGLRHETRDQIIAALSFGFWASLLHSDHEQLWRDSLRLAFPHSSGRRKDVAAVVEPLRVFRNRLAHHDSLLSANVLHQRDHVFKVAGWIDSSAAAWLTQNERITKTYSSRPFPTPDTVVVAARHAWDLYRKCHAYVCQPGRAFQVTEYLAFYADREIKPEVPKILGRVDNLSWTATEAQRLVGSTSADDQRLGQIMATALADGWTMGRYQVFLLTAPGEAGHLSLSAPVSHPGRGAGSAFTQRQRYVSHRQLLTARSTEDL